MKLSPVVIAAAGSETGLLRPDEDGGGGGELAGRGIRRGSVVGGEDSGPEVVGVWVGVSSREGVEGLMGVWAVCGGGAGDGVGEGRC
jgi:hypothetical protein